MKRILTLLAAAVLLLCCLAAVRAEEAFDAEALRPYAAFGYYTEREGGWVLRGYRFDESSGTDRLSFTVSVEGTGNKPGPVYFSAAVKNLADPAAEEKAAAITLEIDGVEYRFEHLADKGNARAGAAGPADADLIEAFAGADLVRISLTLESGRVCTMELYMGQDPLLIAYLIRKTGLLSAIDEAEYAGELEAYSLTR